MRERDLRKVYPANLYRRIRDLLSKGFIEDSSPPEGVAGDARRRYFKITELGRDVAAAEARRLQTLLAEAGDRGLLPTNG